MTLNFRCYSWNGYSRNDLTYRSYNSYFSAVSPKEKVSNGQTPEARHLFSMKVSDAYIGLDQNMSSGLQTLVCGLRLWQVEQNSCFGSIILLLWLIIPKIAKTGIALWTFLDNLIIGLKKGTGLY